jgi:hypothetical protein
MGQKSFGSATLLGLETKVREVALKEDKTTLVFWEFSTIFQMSSFKKGQQ